MVILKNMIILKNYFLKLIKIKKIEKILICYIYLYLFNTIMASCQETYGINYEGNKIYNIFWNIHRVLDLQIFKLRWMHLLMDVLQMINIEIKVGVKKVLIMMKTKLKENIYLIFEFIKIKYLDVNSETKIVLS